MKCPCVYIMTNFMRTVLYVGVTSDLVQRAWQHREGACEGFTKQYKCHFLVYYEQHETMESAITREKQIKKYRREKKEALIRNMNPEWEDLYPGLI